MENIRYNKNPSREYTVKSNPLPYDLDGNFVIDKNINKGNFAPTSYLIPEPKYNYFTDTRSRDEYPRFQQTNNYDLYSDNLYNSYESQKDYNGFNTMTCKFHFFLKMIYDFSRFGK